MNWGVKIIIAFVCFIGLIFTLVYVSVKTDFYLVADNYYEQELAYEDQIQRIKNVNELDEKPELKLNRKERQVELTFPQSILGEMENGKLSFFRASNANFDKEFDLKFNEEGLQVIKTDKMIPGAWKIKIEWTSKGKQFYKEVAIVI